MADDWSDFERKEMAKRRHPSVRVDATFGPLELRFRNGHSVTIREDGTLLIYDNNGRAAGHVNDALDANAIVERLAEVASRARVEPQVRTTGRARSLATRGEPQ